MQRAPQPGVTECLEGGGSSCCRINSRAQQIREAMHHHQRHKYPKLQLGQPHTSLEVPVQSAQHPLLGPPNRDPEGPVWGQMLGQAWVAIGPPPLEPVSCLVARDGAGSFVLCQWPPYPLGSKNQIEESPALDTALSGPLSLVALMTPHLLSPSSPEVHAPAPPTTLPTRPSEPNRCLS